MKYFAVADVHSFFSEMMTALNAAGYDRNNPEHVFVSLGDLMDRGNQPYECLQFVNSLPKDRRVLVKGNHEDLFEQAIARHEFLSHDWHNGTVMTALDLYDRYHDDRTYSEYDALTFMRTCKPYNDYIESTVDYAEVGNAIFVHGWIPCQVVWNGDKRAYQCNDDWRMGDWSQARWVNGMEAWHNGVKVDGKTIYCGHFHTSYGHHYLHNDGLEFPNKRSTNPEHRTARFDPFVDDGIVALDACTVLSGKVNCWVLTEENK